MLTPTSTALAIPAFIAAPPTAPAVLAERVNLSRRYSCAPRLSVSPRSWASSAGSALPRAHGDVASAHHTRPPTVLYSFRQDDFPPTAHSPLHSTSSADWSGGSGVDESCFASRPLDSQQHTTTSPAGFGGRRRRSSTRLGGLRKPRDADGPRSDGEGSGEEAGGDGGKARPSRSQKSYGSSVPASKRQPPEEEDIWSKHSVFEFKSLNDPDTNACAYKGLSGQPRGPSWDERGASLQEPAAPDRRLPSSAQQASAIFDGVEDLLEAERPTSPFGGSPFGDSEVAGTEAAAIDDDLFRFREKGAIAGTSRRREVEPRRRGPTGGGRGGGRGGAAGVGGERSAVKVELATQLGVPATSTYEELRTAYRVEIKRCHPDLAGDNEFRVKFLERKFQKLQGCWDKFSAEQTVGGATAASAAEAEASGQAAQARARARAREAERERQRVAEAAAAAARRSRRPVMDEGRTVLDSGNTSSC